MRLVPLDETDEDAVGAATGNLKLVPYEGLLEGEEAPQRTWGEALSDAWYQYAEGANKLVGAVPNLIAPDSDVAQAFNRYADDWRSKQSKSLRMRYADADERISQAGQGGLLSQAGTAAREFAADPALAARSVTTNLPSMVLGGTLAKAVQGAGALLGLGATGAAGLATGASGAFNSMMNAGDARGDAYESLKRAHMEQGASEEEATRKALEGSWTPAIVGGAAGFISGKTGLEKAIVGGGGGVGRAVARAAKSAAAEMLGEQAEEVLPQMATNYAVGQVDGTTDLMQDIGRTMVETAIASGPGSALSGVAESRNPAERIQSNINRASDMLRQMDDVQAAVHESARQASAQAQAQGLDDIGSAESVEQAISAARRAVSVNDDELLDWAYREAGIDPAELDAARTQAQAEIDSGQQMLDANRTAQERMQAQMDTAAPAASEPAAPESAASEPAAPVQETSAAAEPSAEVTPPVEPSRQEQRAHPETDEAPAATDTTETPVAHDRSPDTASATATPQAKAQMKAQAGQTAAALSSEEWRQKTREAIDASLAREALPEGIKRLHDEGAQQLASGLSSASDPEAFIRDTVQRIQDWPARYDEAKGKNRHVPQEILDEKHRLQGMFNAVGFKLGKATTAQDFERALRAYAQKQQGQQDGAAPAAAAQAAHAARGTAPMLSRSEPTKANYEKRIDELFAGGKAQVGTRVLDRSDVMGLLGHPNIPLMLNERHLADGLTNHPEMTAATWKKVPDWLENPAAVYTDPNHPGRLTVIAPERLAGHPVVMAVEPKAGHPFRGKNGALAPEQLLVTVFAKTTGRLPDLKYLAQGGRLQYADTKTAPGVWQRAGDIPRAGGQTSGAKRILTEASLAGWRKANAPAASRTANHAASQAPAQPTGASAAPTPASASKRRPLSPSLARRTAALQQAVDAIHASWPNAPQTVVVADMQDARIPQAVRDADQAQKSQGAKGEPEGFFVGGKVYLVASQVKTAHDAARVLAHEVLGHHGLRGLYGPQLSSVLDRAGLALRPRVAAKAREYGLHGLGDAARQATNGQVWQSMTKEQRHQAAEEVLAEMAQEQPQLGLVRQLVAAIRSWLRAHVPGFSGLRVSDDEIIRDYILPARGWVMRGQQVGKASNQDALGDAADITPMFSRSKQTQAQYEKRIDELFAGGKANRVGARVLDRSDVLELIGYGSRPMVLQESKVLKGIDNHPHMTAAVWKKVPEWLENPAAVFDSDTESGRLVFVAPEPVNGAPVAMIVEPTPTASGGTQMAVSLLVNAYDRSGATPFMRWIGDGLMRYADTKKFPAVFTQSVGRRLPDTAFQNKPGTRRILTEKNLAGWRKAHAPQKQSDVRFSRTTEENSADETYSYEQGWLDDEPYKPLSIPLNAKQRQLILDTFNEHTEGPHFSDTFDVEQSHDINAKSRAFQALVQSEGWHINPRAAGDKYFLIGNKPLTRDGRWVDTLTIPVRVSDHSNVNRGNHFKTSAINLAPDDGIAFDTFESALWKIRNASESEDGDLLFGGEEPVMFSRSADPQSDLIDPEHNRPQGFELPEETGQQRLRRKLQDYFLRALVVQDAVARQGGKVSEGNDFYLAEELSHGRRAARVNDFARNTVQPLFQKAARLRVDLDELALYAYAKHAPERNARIAEINPDMPDGGSGMSNDEAAAILQKAQSEGKQQALDELHADLMAIAQQTRSLMQDEGLITQKEYDTLEGMYENYIPLRGFEQTDEEGNEAPASARRGSGKGFNVRGKETMRALGRSSRAGLLIENLLADYQRAVDRAERNHVAKVFLQFVRQNPDRKLWQINAKATKQAYNRQTGRVERHTTIDKGEDTIAVKVGGREVYVKVKDELLARALRLAHKDETGESERLLMRTVGLYSSLLRNTLTRYNPEFALTNAARDFTFGAAAVLDDLGEKGAAKYLKHYAGALKAAHRDFKNTQDPAHNEWDQWFKRYQMAGGSTAGFYVKSAEQISKDLRDIALTAGVAAPRTKMENLKMSQAGAAARKLGNILEWAGSVSEHAARVAAFRAAVEMGQSQAKAASIAKNLTTNFDRKGEMGQLVNTFYVFFNAAVQGSHRTLKMMANPKIRHYMAGMTASAVTLAFVAASWGGDDPDDGIAYWDKIPAHVKERNLIIPLPASVQLDDEQQTVGTNGNYIAIPLQYGLNLPVAFGYAVADAMRNMADPSRGRSLAQAAAHMAGAVAGAFNPLGGSVDLGNGSSVAQALLPSVGDAIVQFATGTDAFGKDVAPYKRPGDTAPDSENYNVRQTGSASLAIARAINRATGGNEAESGLIDVSAGSVENLINNLAGGSGKFLYDVLNFAWKGVDWATGNDPELYLRDVPIARRLGGALNGEIDQGIYNANQRKVQEAAGVVKRSIEADIDPSEENITLARMDKHATKIGKKLADLRRKMKRVLEDEDMTRGDKTILLRQIRMQRDALTAQFNADFTAVMREAAQQAKEQP